MNKLMDLFKNKNHSYTVFYCLLCSGSYFYSCLCKCSRYDPILNTLNDLKTFIIIAGVQLRLPLLHIWGLPGCFSYIRKYGNNSYGLF